VKRLRRIILSTTCLLAIVRSAGAADDAWSMARERYACYTSGMTLQELGSGGVTVLSHTPPTKQYCDEARKWGIKTCPYISLYKVIDLSKSPNLDTEGTPFWHAVDASRRPEWFLRREDGQIRRPFDEPNYAVGWEQSCCNHRDLIEAYQQGVRNVMDLGAGGVFVDNVHPYPDCFGVKLGLHEHDWPDKNNIECYKMALRGVCDAVKSYGKDRVVILNPGGASKDYFPYGDCVMWESFVWRSPFEGDKAPMIKTRRWDPPSWAALLAAIPHWRPLGEKGPSIAPLTYLPDAASEAENAFFAYAMARLAGFDQWTGTCVQRRDILRRLYRVRTEPAVSEIGEAGGAAYRQFQNGLIVCNYSTQPVEVRVPVLQALGTSLVELFEMCETPITEDHVTLTLPAESGRVVVTRSEALDNLLREVEGQAVAARLHLEQQDTGRNEASTVALREQLQAIGTLAATLRENVREAGFPGPADCEAVATLAAAATGVETPSTHDAFLSERCDNLRHHAGLAAGLTAK
jgi:hypothetical protein